MTLFFIFSCGKNNKDNEDPGIFDVIEGVSDLKDITDEAEKIEEESDKLAKTAPISNEELKTFLPENLLGFARTKFSIGNQFVPDMAAAEAEYENENQNIILFSILDGAGETGSAMVTFARLSFARDFEEQTETGFKKSNTINGFKAIEEVEKDSYTDGENSKIELLVANRFIVSFDGEGIPLKQLRKAVDEIDLTGLQQKAK